MSKIVVVVSVDWEGRSLLPENLQVIDEFRRKHPEIPLQHFLNAAYYTRPGIDASATTSIIRQALRPGDEHGLHLHAWASLLAAAGVKPRIEPRFLDDAQSVPKAPDDWDFYPAEAGYDVPIECLESVELDRVIATSCDILVAQGFKRAVSFRAGGWMSGPRVRAALVRNGFQFDCSAVDPRLTRRRFGEIPLFRWLNDLWPNIDESSQPCRMETAAGSILQIPNNAGLVDYASAQDQVDIFERVAGRWQRAPQETQLVSTGFHQETARIYLDRLDDAVKTIKRLAEDCKLPLVFQARYCLPTSRRVN